MVNVDYPGLITFLVLLLVFALAVNIHHKEKASQVVGFVPNGADALVRESGEYLRMMVETGQPLARADLGGTLTINGERWRAIRDKGSVGPTRFYVLEEHIQPN